MKHEISAGGIVFKKITTKGSGQATVVWLICQHAQHQGWVFPKGLVGDHTEGESLEEAALRETEEEGGVKAKIMHKLEKPAGYFYKWEGELIKKTVHYFLMEYESGDPKNHDHEMMDAKFVKTDDVIQTLSYKSDRKAFREALELLGKLG